MGGLARLAGVCVAVLSLLVAAACGGQSRQPDDERVRVLIDSLLPEISAASGLEVREQVRFAVQPRAEVRAFIEAQLREELGPEELEGTQRVYTALGLLPDTLDLRALLLDLYTEQVIGYYDPRTGRLYLVEGLSVRDVAPVVAHELVHALQDQWVDLDSLVHRRRGNDRQMAAQAAAEGQAMIVMIAMEARAAGQPINPGALPDLAEMLGPVVEAGNAASPVFARAPRIIRETMIFPYLSGASFVQTLFRAAGPDSDPPVPFGDLLPQSTEQVMRPESRFLQERDPPTELEVAARADGWRVVYENTLGQLETSILLSEHLGPGADAAADGWDGDRYALIEDGAGREALVWYSVWDDTASADRFADAYRRILDARDGRHGSVERSEVNGRAVVRVVDAPEATRLADVPLPGLVGLEEGAGL